MDTKSKGNKGFWSWMAFFMGINFVVLGLLVGINLPFALNYSLDDVAKICAGEDVKSLEPFKKRMGSYLTGSASELLGKDLFYEYGYYTDYGFAPAEPAVVQDGGYRYEMTNGITTDMAITEANTVEGNAVLPVTKREADLKRLSNWLNEEGENLLYAIEGPEGEVLSNMDSQPMMGIEEQVILPEGYNYALYFDGQQVVVSEKKGEQIIITDPHRKDSGYPYVEMGLFFAESDFMKENPDLAKCSILLMVKETLVDNPYGVSGLYHLEEMMNWSKILVVGAICILVLGWCLLVFAFIKRQEKRRFEGYLVAISGKIWLEVKAFLIFFAMLGFIGGLSGCFSGWMDIGDRLFCVGALIVSAWWLYVMLLDLITHKSGFFSRNSISWLLSTMKQYVPMKPFQEKMLSRAYRLLLAEVILVLIAITTVFTVVIPLCAISLGIYLIYWYMKQFKEMVIDIGKICDQIERIKQGDMVTPLILNKDADLAFAAGYLNSIQEGITIATDEKIKSERMKVDLVTNVSHDLKTPLTSIISYVDLLDKEEGLSAVAKDYVHILGQKSERLKSLINDLFDLSKATSANLEVDLKQIDLAKLMRQVGADLEEEIAASGLTFKVRIPLEPVLIISDGSKLHRVFENLILNALKYSLVNSRVFIDLVADEEKAWVIIKNIANYEMDFDVETIAGRFVRGDKARTTEGSGLGLAIAQSYTEACGGVFEVVIDGDMFKVELMFKLS